MPQQSAKVLDGGRLILPVEYRRTLNINPGDSVVIELDGDELRVRSRDAGLRRIQERLRKYIPEGVSLADELIVDRRAEAAREELE